MGDETRETFKTLRDAATASGLRQGAGGLAPEEWWKLFEGCGGQIEGHLPQYEPDGPILIPPDRRDVLLQVCEAYVGGLRP